MWSQGAQIHGFIVAQMLVLYIYKIYSLFLIPREFLVIYLGLIRRNCFPLCFIHYILHKSESPDSLNYNG